MKWKRVEEQSLLLRPLIWSVILFYVADIDLITTLVLEKFGVFNLCIRLEQFNTFLSSFFFLFAQFLAFYTTNASHFILDIICIKIIDN